MQAIEKNDESKNWNVWFIGTDMQNPHAKTTKNPCILCAAAAY
jgi:hypothetical protein